MPVHHAATPGFARVSASPTAAPPPAPGGGLFGSDGFTFRDLIDLVNPLHHIPVVGQVYRRLTGDVIDPAMRIAGGALFGGPLGAAFAAAGTVLDAALDEGEGAPAAAPSRPVQVAETARGGWMVAASRPAPAQPVFGPPPAVAEAVAEAPPPARRGGWMVAAAYAMADARAAADGRLDTTA